jgi:hypothetical protein
MMKIKWGEGEEDGKIRLTGEETGKTRTRPFNHQLHCECRRQQKTSVP